MNSKYVLAQAGVDDQDEGVVGLAGAVAGSPPLRCAGSCGVALGCASLRFVALPSLARRGAV